MFYHGAGRVVSEEVVVLPIPGWADGSWHKAAAAIWADVAQHGVYTMDAEGALVGADARLHRIGWECFVAVLAGGAEFKHGDVPLVKNGSNAIVGALQLTQMPFIVE